MAAVLFSSYPNTARIQIAQSALPLSAASSLNFRCSNAISAHAHPPTSSSITKQRSDFAVKRKIGIYNFMRVHIEASILRLKA